MPYTYKSLLNAVSDLSRRLYDPSAVFWTADEMISLIQEALRTWGGLTNYWRSEFVLTLVEDTVWYDLTDATACPNTLVPLTVTDVDIYNAIERHFLEPPTGAVWSGSSQFNASDMIAAVQRRRDELISDSGCVVNRHTYPAIQGRIFMDESTIDVVRVAWLPVTNPSGYVNSALWPDDGFATQLYERGSTVEEPGTPTSYLQSTEPPLSFDTNISPAVPGEYEVLSIDAGPTLDPLTAQDLSVLDNYSWVIKWGAMADMLNRSSNASDPMRAQYCNLRYKQGMALLASAPVVLLARINNTPLDVDSVQNVTNFRCNWQSEATGQPDVMMTAGLNLIGFAKTPDAGPYSVTITVAQNAPIPTQLSDSIQIGKDEYDALLDYCVHVASFKMGGAEFVATMPLFQRFMKQAALYNDKLNSLGEYTDAMVGLSKMQNQSNPVYATVDSPTGGEE